MRARYHTDRPWRLATDCPRCGGTLRLRRRRADGGQFLGCARYPTCPHTEDYDPYVAALAAQLEDLEAELADARRHRTATPSLDLARELRGLIALVHPDRWPHATDLAHEVTARLTDLRRRVAA